jgi:hypothetical protein
MNKKIVSVVCLAFVLLMLAAVPVSAGKSYQTYTYSLAGKALYSPDAYTPVRTINSDFMGLTTAIDDPRDLVVDESDNIYIADAGNNRIVVLDRYFKLRFTISKFKNDEGIDDSLNTPSGVFVTPDLIYVADTNQNRIVTFDREGNFVRVIPEPESDLFDTDSVYKPVALVVDDYNRMYVVSSTTYQGIIVMDHDGTFISFMGAQKVVMSAWDRLWRKLQTDEQKANSISYVATEFNNIDMNEKGFIYITTDQITESRVSSAIRSKTKSGDYLPVKLINLSGDEVMSRNGFWPPAGEIDFSGSRSDGSINGVSKIVDVACGPEFTWSIIDQKRQKVFTYDYQGNLLFAFGDSGPQLGNLVNIGAIVYTSDATMLILDKTNDNITVYSRTEYGDILIKALANQNARQYDRAIEDWTEILKRNSNFDVAYVGIGNALYRRGEFEKALEYYEASYYTSGWSDSYKEIRKNWISKYVVLIPIAAVAVIAALVVFFRWAGKVNKRAETSGTERTFKEHLLFGFHLILHPFDGFWDLKHEKRGSFGCAWIYVGLTILAFFYQDVGSGYLSNPSGIYGNLFSDALGVLVPLFLWVVGNWCLTTLFDGEGSLKDIFIACSYSLLPIPMLMIPMTIFSNFAVSAELQLIEFINTIGLIWAFLLIFCGMMVTHDYTIFKNFITTIGTLVAMGFIMFIAILFTTLLGKIVSFITNIITEINYRL